MTLEDGDKKAVEPLTCEIGRYDELLWRHSRPRRLGRELAAALQFLGGLG
jgi:hypothetical protein